MAKETQKSITAIKQELIESCPDIEELLDLWKNNSEVKALELTPVGLVIAILNYNGMIGNNSVRLIFMVQYDDYYLSLIYFFLVLYQ